MTTSPLWEGVVFDLDGTLVDSVGDLRNASNRLLSELRRPPLDLATIKSFVGDGAPRLVERVVTSTGGWPASTDPRTLLERFLEIYEADPGATTRPYPGVLDTVRALRRQGLRIGICTNKPAKATRRLLETLGMSSLFDAVAAGDTYPTRKPSPQPLLGVLHQLGLAPARAVMVGDNEHDVAAGRAAGMGKVFVVAHGYSRVPLAALPHDGIIETFAELPRLLGLERVAAAPAPVSRLLFCRHGETVSNINGWLAGSRDVELTDRGREQAHLAARALRNQAVSAIYASPLRRAKETASIISGELDLPVREITELAERHWGELEGHAFPADLARPEVPGGETLASFEQRVAAGLARIPQPEQGLPLIVAHAGTAQAILSLFGIPPHAGPVDNALPILMERRA